MSFAPAACHAWASKHTPVVLQHRHAMIVFVSHTGLWCLYVQEWQRQLVEFSVNPWIYLINPATWQPCIVYAGIRQVQHLGIHGRQNLNRILHPSWHKQWATPFIFRLSDITQTEMPCQPLRRVKNVRIRLSLILNLDYSNPEAAPYSYRLLLSQPQWRKTMALFVPPRTDSTAQ